MKFILDSNVGKLARWLRIAGFDTLFLKDIDDGRLVRIALKEERILLTRDTGILERRLITSGRLKAILIDDENVKAQLRQVIDIFDLTGQLMPFTRCSECNEPLTARNKDEVEELIPQHVFRTQTQYMQCPMCERVYWRGTHWQRMARELEEIAGAV